MLDKKQVRKSIINLIKEYDDNSARTAEILYEILEEVYYDYQNEAIERFCLEGRGECL
jgi:hypothetical protein